MAAATGKGLQLLEDRLRQKEAGAEAAGFDIAVIVATIAALVPLIQNCFSPTPRALRRRLFNRARVAAAVRGAAPALSWAEGLKKADVILDLAEGATDEELQALIDDCCGDR